ncbi:hypothetical protein niasHT_030207 [Heterodera trifolii]|uniref:Uncharacterized protein n=1 Tax=Heterodera trifolii TaxID=157864 RepID=A0ABD2K2W8_9BILA
MTCCKKISKPQAKFSNAFSGISARHDQTKSRNAFKSRAPNNTTSFLMSDLEKRQQHDEDDQQQQTDALGQVAGTQRGQKVLGSKEIAFSPLPLNGLKGYRAKRLIGSCCSQTATTEC